MSARHMSVDLYFLFKVYWFCWIYVFFMLWSASQLPYNRGSQYLVDTLITEVTCEPFMCHSTDLIFMVYWLKFVSSFHDYVTFSLAIQAVMGSPYFDPRIFDGGYMCIFMHVYFTYLVWLKGKPRCIYLWQKTAKCLHINA